MSVIDRNPSFFKVGGLLLPEQEQRVTVGKNQNGSFYIAIQGRYPGHIDLTPRLTFDLAAGLLKALGYTIEKITPPK